MIALINIMYENPFVTNKVSMGFVPQKSENQKVFNNVRVIDYLK